MSFTNAKYDNCAYKQNLLQSTGVLAHVIEKNRFINVDQCRVQTLGVIQGNPVDPKSFNAKNSLVDIENDLFGLGKQLTQCPENKNKFCKKEFEPKCDIKDEHKSCPSNIIKYKKKVNFKQCDIKKCW